MQTPELEYSGLSASRHLLALGAASSTPLSPVKLCGSFAFWIVTSKNLFSIRVCEQGHAPGLRKEFRHQMSFSVSYLTEPVQLGLHFKGQVLTALLMIKIKLNRQKRAVPLAGGCFCLHMAETPFGETDRHGDTETGWGEPDIHEGGGGRQCWIFCVLCVLYPRVAATSSSSS